MNTYDFLTQIKGGKQLTQADDVRAYVMDVTPEVAYNFLALNFEHNRAQRQGNIQRWTSSLNRGEFLDGSPIRIASCDGEYVLTDGQHRLTAIAESGLAATMTVIVTDKRDKRDVRNEYAVGDTISLPRSIKDSIIALDEDETLPPDDNLRFYSAAAKIICGNFNLTANVHLSNIPRADVYETLKSFNDEIALLGQWMGGKKSGGRRFMRAVVLAVAMVTTKHAERTVAQSFWREACLNDGLFKSDPRRKLHEYLHENAGTGMTGQKMGMMAAAKCWNEYVAGNEVSTLRMPKSMPDIALTPYPMKEAMPTEE